MKLSDIPVEQLQCTDDWVTGVNGRKGTITGLKSSLNGRYFELVIEIKWSASDTEPQRYGSYIFPDHCDNLTINPASFGKFLKPYAYAQIQKLKRQAEFYQEYTTDQNITDL